jgi:hypothetical protein
MFKRVILEDWASVVPMIAFGSLAAIFLLTTVRALMMKSGDREKMARLPLSDPSEGSDEPRDPTLP